MKIGILGNGQLGQMLASSISDQQDLQIELYDLRNHSEQALAQTLANNDRISFETENIPAHIVKAMEPFADKVFPSLKALKVFQNRLLEKQALRDAGIQTADFKAVNSLQDVHDAVSELGLPIVLKTTTEGYDGKGQYVLRSPADAEPAWQEIGNRELIAEAFVDFKRETSVIGSRDEKGNIKIWPLTENVHFEGILRYSLYPIAGLSAEKVQIAENYLSQLAESLDYVGTITLELFETEQGFIANEVAPRVHNSGHWSIEGAATSQFRNHMLAISGQDITDTSAKFNSVAMINVISDESPTDAGKTMDNTFVHSYHKEARPNRKLGHVTLVAESDSERNQMISKLAALIPSDIRDI